jgi:hypothetical protein
MHGCLGKQVTRKEYFSHHGSPSKAMQEKEIVSLSKPLLVTFGNFIDGNDLAHVVAPTGMASFNVLGETLYRFEGFDWNYIKK